MVNLGLELYDNSLFLFCGSRNDRFKGLLWDGEGFILLYKRFENRCYNIMFFFHKEKGSTISGVDIEISLSIPIPDFLFLN